MTSNWPTSTMRSRSSTSIDDVASSASP
jgi:hypothetical protein